MSKSGVDHGEINIHKADIDPGSGSGSGSGSGAGEDDEDKYSCSLSHIPAVRPKTDIENPTTIVEKTIFGCGGVGLLKAFMFFLLALDLVDLSGDIAMISEWMGESSATTNSTSVVANATTRKSYSYSSCDSQMYVDMATTYIQISFFFSTCKLISNIKTMWLKGGMQDELGGLVGLHGEDLPVIAAAVCRGKMLSGTTFFSTIISLGLGIYGSIEFNWNVIKPIWVIFGEIVNDDGGCAVCMTAGGVLLFSIMALALLCYDLFLVYLFFQLFDSDITCEQQREAEFAAGFHMFIACFVVICQLCPCMAPLYDCFCDYKKENAKKGEELKE
jgi:hypothetical protein